MSSVPVHLATASTGELSRYAFSVQHPESFFSPSYRPITYDPVSNDSAKIRKIHPINQRPQDTDIF